MARSKKKKWKSRIKKALKLAAIGGAGYLAAKRFGGSKATVADTAASEDANINTNAPILGTDHIIKKAPVVADTAATVAAPIKSEGRTRLSVDGVTPGMVLNARRKVPGYGSAVAPPGILNPYRAPRTHSIRGMKKGGRVTGAAKRGFGRALMKGKK